MNTKNLLEIANNTLLYVVDRPDIVMCKGNGMYLYDEAGKEYLDFIGGWAVNCLGHSPKVIADVLYQQANLLVNASPAFYNRPMLEYADRLVRSSCFDRVFFSSTGAEANEGAIKLARKYGEKFKGGANEIITAQHGFHGRTLTTMSATGKEAWSNLFEPKAGGFCSSTFNDIDSVINKLSDRTCAIMIEPIQGEGGVNIATQEYMVRLRELCDQEQVVLIFDEIQTGMGRTGELYCYQHFGIEPDIMTLGKGIGGGFPLSAMLAKEAYNCFEAGEQGGTYTGQPLAMAVGLAVLNELQDKGFLDKCRKMGEQLLAALRELQGQYAIDNIRGVGLLAAFDLLAGDSKHLVGQCLRDGLIINSPKQHTIRLIPPLIVENPHIDQLKSVLSRYLPKKS